MSYGNQERIPARNGVNAISNAKAIIPSHRRIADFIAASYARLRWLLVKTYLRVGLIVVFVGFLFWGGR